MGLPKVFFYSSRLEAECVFTQDYGVILSNFLRFRRQQFEHRVAEHMPVP